jgi:SAM-dependent methyltransferase
MGQIIFRSNPISTLWRSRMHAITSQMIDQHCEQELRDAQADGYAANIHLSRGPYWMRGQIGLVLAYLHPGRRHHIYDAGTGVGFYSMEIARRYPQSHIHAVDFSPRSIQMVRQQARTLHYGNIEADVADIIEYIPEENSFDRAICNDVLQHLPGPGARLQAVRNIYRSLRPGGIFVTSNYRWGGWIKHPTPKEDANYHGEGLYRYAFTENELSELLREAGFRTAHSFGIIRTPRKLRHHLPPAIAPLVERGMAVLGLGSETAQYVLAWGKK